MLTNVVEAIEEAQQHSATGEAAPTSKAGLRHVYVQAGSKWYGQHLGKYKTPAKEDDPR